MSGSDSTRGGMWGESRRKGKGKEREVEVVGGGGALLDEDSLLAERNFMVARRQAEMEAVYDKHDSLIRELFHMERFRMMIAYNPVEAKEDNSAVFREFKEKYDLLEKVSASSSLARTTRRGRSERWSMIQGSTSISAPPTSPVPSRARAKAKSQQDNTAIWDIIASAKKGKGKMSTEKSNVENGVQGGEEAREETAVGEQPESISAFLGRRKAGEKRFRESLDAIPPSLSPRMNGRQNKRTNTVPSPTHVVASHKRRKTNHGVIPDRVDVAESISAVNRGTDDGLNRRLRHASINAALPTPRVSPTRTLQRGTKPPSRFLRDPHQQSAPLNRSIESRETPTVPRYNVKSLKLIVRRPPPLVSHPRQRPPSSLFKCSIPKFLNSYKTLNDEDVDDATFQQRAHIDAVTYEHIKQLRRECRFIPNAEVHFGSSSHSTSLPRTSKDTWDHVVAAVVSQGQTRPKKSVGKQIAAQIASKIQAYWEGHAARKDKVKAQEEKKLRALAKATIKLVLNEWKKTVFHIREQKRLKLEAEERRRGHEHLDAILNQSGHILEAQQGDLMRGDVSRSRSRSSSVSLSLRNWGLDEEEEEEEDEEETNDSQSGEGSADEANPEEDEEADGDGQAESDEDDGGHESEEDAETSARALLGTGYLGPHLPPSITPTESPDLDQSRSQSVSPHPTPPQEPNTLPEPDSDAILDFDKFAQTLSRSTPPPWDTIQCAIRQEQAVSDRSESIQAVTKVLVSSETIEEAPSIRGSPTSNEVISSQERITAIDTDAQPKSEADTAPQPSCQSESPDNATLLDSETTLLHVDPPVSGKDDVPQSPLAMDVDHIQPSSSQDGLASEEFSATQLEEDSNQEPEQEDNLVPEYLKPYAVAPVQWEPDAKIKPPVLLRGILRPYQQAGLEWLASLHTNNLNGILADEMGLGKTIQTIALLAHLACDRGIWGPHLIIVPTSVLLNWEMEFKKFLPGFKILSYHGNTKRRKELRQGWNDKHHFNVCVTSYTLASRDAHIFKRKPWYYMILDEAHMIKNFKSQRWNILLMFRSFRRLLLTGTPLQNNLTELWALLQFLMSGSNFANLKEFGDWFSNPLEKAVEMGSVHDEDTMQRVTKLHTVLRPYLLRRLKRDVEKELPSKFEHLVLCPLSKRQRFLYDEFMSRAQTRDDLQSGIYQKIANILMQLRKVCNHPNLFEVRPIVTSFAMQRAAIADFEIKELLIRRRMLDGDTNINFESLGLHFINQQGTSLLAALETRRLDATSRLPFINELPGEPPPRDTRTISGYRQYTSYQRRADTIARWSHIGYLNRLRCTSIPIFGHETLELVKRFSMTLVPSAYLNYRRDYLDQVYLVNSTVKSYADRAAEMASVTDRFAVITPPVVALDMPRIALSGYDVAILNQDLDFDALLHRVCVKLQIAFPDPSLLQYDCGKLQELTRLLREKKAGGHRVLIFTQMTRVLDILEIFLNFHGYLYLRLDGATKIEDRQYITERFNVDARIFCFIASSRSGGVGINLTGADTVIFYDSDFNPQMDRQCEDRAHRIGQIRDVHIYRFISQHTVEEAMLRKANQKRSLDDLVIQKGEFDWRSLFSDENALTKALGEFEDTEDAHAAAVATREAVAIEGADEAEFDDAEADTGEPSIKPDLPTEADTDLQALDACLEDQVQDKDEGGTVVDYMLAFVQLDWENFKDWHI